MALLQYIYSCFIVLCLVAGNDGLADLTSCDFENTYCDYTRKPSYLLAWTRSSTLKENNWPSSGCSGKEYLAVDGGTYGSTNEAKLISQQLPPGDKCLQFCYYVGGTEADKLTLSILYTSNNKEQSMWTTSGDTGGSWQHARVMIPSGTDKYQITFKGTRTRRLARGNVVAIDDITSCSETKTRTGTTTKPTTTKPTTTKPTTTKPTTTKPTTTKPTTTKPPTTKPTITKPTTTKPTTTKPTTTNPTTTNPTTTKPTTTKPTITKLTTTKPTTTKPTITKLTTTKPTTTKPTTTKPTTTKPTTTKPTITKPTTTKPTTTKPTTTKPTTTKPTTTKLTTTKPTTTKPTTTKPTTAKPTITKPTTTKPTTTKPTTTKPTSPPKIHQTDPFLGDLYADLQKLNSRLQKLRRASHILELQMEEVLDKIHEHQNSIV